MCSLSTIFNWILAPSQVVLSDFFQQQCCEFYHVCSLSSPPCDDVYCFVVPPGCTRNLYMHSPRTVHQKEIHPGTQMTPEAPKVEDMAGFQWNIDLQFYMSRSEMSQSSIFNLPPPNNTKFHLWQNISPTFRNKNSRRTILWWFNLLRASMNCSVNTCKD